MNPFPLNRIDIRRQILGIALCCALLPGLASGQLTDDQKATDLQNLASLYAKRYAPYEWKRDVVGFDLFYLSPWLERAKATRTDLEFYDLMSEYVASLNDAHDGYSLPSNFSAGLNFFVDIYDGLLLVDSINRTRLPAAEFPFMTGYELVSIDGVPAQTLLEKFLRYNVAANERSTRRLAAELITIRPQVIYPFAEDVPEISSVEFRRPDGKLETYRIPWAKSGLPLSGVGLYPEGPLGSGEAIEPAADYMEPLRRLQNIRLPDRGVLNFGSRIPIFANSLGSNFTQRLGAGANDVFFSGVFGYGPYRIGFIRIPSFSPTDPFAALTSFEKEIAYFQANTDGLIIDEMRNPGGTVTYCNQLLSLLMPDRWTAIGFEIRATSEWVIDISSSVESAKAQGAPPLIVAQLEAIRDAIVSANHEMRGRTGPIALDDVVLDREPLQGVAFTKPLMVLADEMTASGGDYFAATIQDNGRGPIFGWRTMGAGGSVAGYAAGSYSLGSATVTESLMSRNRDVITQDFPPTRYIENVGVRPDIQNDYMTRENLIRSGGAYVDAFLQAMYEHIQKGR